MLIRDLLNELNRELALRAQVFPKLIAQGRLTQGEASERVDRMKAARDVLIRLLRRGIEQTDQLGQDVELCTTLNTQSQSTQIPINIKGAE